MTSDGLEGGAVGEAEEEGGKGCIGGNGGERGIQKGDDGGEKEGKRGPGHSETVNPAGVKIRIGGDDETLEPTSVRRR